MSSRRVAYEGGIGEPRHGTVVGARQQYLKILMDGDVKPGLYHPTWSIRFLDAAAPGVEVASA